MNAPTRLAALPIRFVTTPPVVLYAKPRVQKLVPWASNASDPNASISMSVKLIEMPAIQIRFVPMNLVASDVTAGQASF